MLLKRTIQPQELVGQKLLSVQIANTFILKIQTENAVYYALWDGEHAQCRLLTATGSSYLKGAVKSIQTSKWEKSSHGQFQIKATIQTDVGQAEIAVVCDRDSFTVGDIIIFDAEHLVGHPKVAVEEETFQDLSDL